MADEAANTHVRAERIVGRTLLGLRSVALFLGGETAFGPVFVGAGRASSGAANAYRVAGAREAPDSSCHRLTRAAAVRKAPGGSALCEVMPARGPRGLCIPPSRGGGQVRAGERLTPGWHGTICGLPTASFGIACQSGEQMRTAAFLSSTPTLESFEMNIRMKPLLAAMVLATTAPAFAVTLTANYGDASISGGVFQNAAGQFASTGGAGFSDVTGLFKLNANAAFSYFQNAIHINWSHDVTFQLEDLTPFGADGISQVLSLDANNRTATSRIALDTSAISHFYLDPTPASNSEWTMLPKTSTLGGATVNVGRKGGAVSGGPADGRTDILTLMILEIAHSLGVADGSPRFVALVGADSPNAPGDTNARLMTMPTALTGYAATYVLPFRAASGHVSSAAAGGTFLEAVTSEPGFGEGDRALLSDVEIHALCLINGCTSPSDFTLNPSISAVPEPESWLLMALGGAVLIPALRKRRLAAA